jgi:uncharacterized protein YegL
MSTANSVGVPVSGAPAAYGGLSHGQPSDIRYAAEVPEADPAPEGGPKALAAVGLMVLDVSWSMVDVLGEVQTSLTQMAEQMRLDPATANLAHLGVVSFADDARTELKLVRIADSETVFPALRPRGSGTNFHAGLSEALRFYRDQLPALAKAEDGTKRKIYRPTIYFVSDGQPNTGLDWRPVLHEIRTRSWRPSIFAFGFGDADRAVIKEIADEGLAYFAADGKRPHEVFQSILHVIFRSMVSQVGQSQVALQNPTAPPPPPVAINPAADPATANLAFISTID